MKGFDDFTEELNIDEFESVTDVNDLFAAFADPEPEPEEILEEIAPELDKTQKLPKNRKKIKKKKRRKKNYVLRFLIIVALIVGAVQFIRSDFFTVTKVAVDGNQYYTASQVFQLSGIQTGNNIFRTKTDEGKEALLADPYIKYVTIKKELPGTIHITVEERVEYATVPYGDQYVLIDDTGMVLRISNQEPALPLLEGMTIIDMTPGNPLNVEESYLLTDTLELLAVVAENDMYFKKVNFSTVVVKAYIYDSLYCEGTPANITASMESVARLVSELYAENVDKGIIRVGKDNYLSFDPNITE